MKCRLNSPCKEFFLGPCLGLHSTNCKDHKDCNIKKYKFVLLTTMILSKHDMISRFDNIKYKVIILSCKTFKVPISSSSSTLVNQFPLGRTSMLVRIIDDNIWI